ncbi:alpha-L-fucosidase [Bacteroides fragilis]|nr:alpha-L-fucosidase [Bacteroides fragilis]
MGQSTYKPDWESIDKRPVPAWFENAKFGIFIHWDYILYRHGRPKELIRNGINIGLIKTLMGNGNFTGTEIYDYHRKNVWRRFHLCRFCPHVQSS